MLRYSNSDQICLAVAMIGDRVLRPDQRGVVYSVIVSWPPFSLCGWNYAISLGLLKRIVYV